MFDAWNLVGIGGGSAALTWLAAGQHPRTGNTLRLSLDKSGSLIGDVRVIGAGLCWLASMYTKGTTKKALQTATAAMGLSVLQTEVVRMQQTKIGAPVKRDLPYFPSYGAIGGPTHTKQHAHAPQSAWASR